MARREDNLWMRRYHPAEQARVRLVCLPHAGGSASFYLPMARALFPRVDVLCVQYPGRQDRRHEPCIASVDELANRVSEELRPWLDQPIALFGHSLGGSLAYEVARRLERANHPPAHVFVSGRRAPSRHRDERVHQRDDEGLLADVRALSGTDIQVFDDEDLLRMVLPAIRSDYQAAETYRYQPGPKLSCPITVFIGSDDPKVTVEEARAWADHTDGGLDFYQFTGGHFFLTHHQTEILNLLSDTLAVAPEAPRAF